MRAKLRELRTKRVRKHSEAAGWFLCVRTDVRGPSGASYTPRQSARERPLERTASGSGRRRCRKLSELVFKLRAVVFYEARGPAGALLRVDFSLSYCDISPPLPVSHRTHRGRALTHKWLVRQNVQSGFIARGTTGRCCHAAR